MSDNKHTTMKTRLIALVTLACSFAASFADSKPVELNTAIEAAEQNAAKAILKGDLPAAQGWANVVVHLRVSQYVAPLGDLFGQFKGHVGNLTSFISAGISVDSATPVTQYYQNPFRTQSLITFIQNDPEEFRANLARVAMWDLLWQGLSYDEREKLTPEVLEETRTWIQNGAPKDKLPPLVVNCAAKPAFVSAHARLQALMITTKTAQN